MGLRISIRLWAGILLAGCSPGALAQELVTVGAATGPEPTFSRTFTEDRGSSLPTELKAESAIYLQRRLRQWVADDARNVLGEPLRHRDAYDKGEATGDIYAFRDPTGRYREFELLFDRKSKTLRAVFIYPGRMTWDECRALWGDRVNTTPLGNGHVFRSYLFRRLDVLADRDGNVINLGIY